MRAVMGSNKWAIMGFESQALSAKVIKLVHATQLGMKFIMLINVKMPTNVGILTFISMITFTN